MILENAMIGSISNTNSYNIVNKEYIYDVHALITSFISKYYNMI